MLNKLKQKIKQNKKPKWQMLTDEASWEQLLASSHQHPVLLLKHSTRCATSSMAKSRLERNASTLLKQADLYLLDIISHRQLSNHIAQRTHVEHESPQLLLIRNGKVTYHTSHNGISSEDVLPVLNE